MTEFKNPALQAFIAAIGAELMFAQILIRKQERGFELRHVDDRDKAPEHLQLLEQTDLRKISQFTQTGAFRPLKSAPNLRAEWRYETATEAALEFALNTFYPGAIADWFSVRFSKTNPTHYNEFTRRQTGIYRITAKLTDKQAIPMIRACCHQAFCLKQRLWTANGLETDWPAEKSLIPCLEPCAILLEFARKAMRLEQLASENGGELEVADSNLRPAEEIREADFENPKNPRRRQLILEQQKANA